MSLLIMAAASSTSAPVPLMINETVRTALLLTLLGFIPALLVCTTSFVRIAVVLSMVRHAFGMPETPPTIVLITLSLFLTLLSTGTALEAVAEQGVRPFIAGKLALDEAARRGAAPLREFMLRQVHDEDLATIYEIARKPLPDRPQDVGLVQLVPAFMLNELRTAFTIGFVILLPFLLIDLVVSAILLSLGMLMVPPNTISLPLKILMFVLIDGWGLLVRSVVGSFQ